MHNKRKGNTGELKVAADLSSKGYSVFTELGDISKIDLILEVDKQLYKIQVKSTNSKQGRADLRCTKSAPSYKFKYKEKDVDVFALYVIDKEQIIYISAKEALKLNTVSFRVEEAKNNQIVGTRLASDYKNIENVLGS